VGEMVGRYGDFLSTLLPATPKHTNKE